MLETFTHATFAPLLGQTFHCRVSPAAGVDMHLIAAHLLTPDTTSQEQAQRRLPFSLLFRGPRGIVLPQRIYTLSHTTLGTFGLFLVPIGPDAEGMRYEAIFT
jgi:hypothetical protein